MIIQNSLIMGCRSNWPSECVQCIRVRRERFDAPWLIDSPACASELIEGLAILAPTTATAIKLYLDSTAEYLDLEGWSTKVSLPVGKRAGSRFRSPAACSQRRPLRAQPQQQLSSRCPRRLWLIHHVDRCLGGVGCVRSRHRGTCSIEKSFATRLDQYIVDPPLPLPDTVRAQPAAIRDCDATVRSCRDSTHHSSMTVEGLRNAAMTSISAGSIIIPHSSSCFCAASATADATRCSTPSIPGNESVEFSVCLRTEPARTFGGLSIPYCIRGQGRRAGSAQLASK